MSNQQRNTRLRLLSDERDSTTTAHARRLVQCLDSSTLDRLRARGTFTIQDVIDVLGQDRIGKNDLTARDVHRMLRSVATTGTVAGAAVDPPVSEHNDHVALTWDVFMDFIVNASTNAGVRDSQTMPTVTNVRVTSAGTSRQSAASEHSEYELMSSRYGLFSSWTSRIDVVSAVRSYEHLRVGVVLLNKTTVRLVRYQPTTGENAAPGHYTLRPDPNLTYTTKEHISGLDYMSQTHQVVVCTPRGITLVGLTGTKQVVTRTVGCATPQSAFLRLPRTSWALTGGLDGSLSLWKVSVGLQPSLTLESTVTRLFSGAVMALKVLQSDRVVFVCINGHIGVVSVPGLELVQHMSVASRMVDFALSIELGWAVAADENGCIRAWPVSDGEVVFRSPAVFKPKEGSERRPVVAVGLSLAENGNACVVSVHKDFHVSTWDLELRVCTTYEPPERDSRRSSVVELSYVLQESDGQFLFGSPHSATYFFRRRSTEEYHRVAGQHEREAGSVSRETTDDVRLVRFMAYDLCDGVLVTLLRTGFAMWSIRTGLLMQAFRQLCPSVDDEFTCGTWHQQDQLLIAGTRAGLVCFINVASASVVATYRCFDELRQRKLKYPDPIERVSVFLLPHVPSGVVSRLAVLTQTANGEVRLTTSDKSTKVTRSELGKASATVHGWATHQALLVSDGKLAATMHDVLHHAVMIVGNQVYDMESMKPTLSLFKEMFSHTLVTPLEKKAYRNSSVLLVFGVTADSKLTLVCWDRRPRNVHAIRTVTSWAHRSLASGMVVTVTSLAYYTSRRVLYVGDDDGLVTAYDLCAVCDDLQDDLDAEVPPGTNLGGTVSGASTSRGGGTDATPRPFGAPECLNQWLSHRGGIITHIRVVPKERLVFTATSNGAIRAWTLAGCSLGELGTNRCAPYHVEACLGGREGGNPPAGDDDSDEDEDDDDGLDSPQIISPRPRVTQQKGDLPPKPRRRLDKTDSEEPTSFFLTSSSAAGATTNSSALKLQRKDTSPPPLPPRALSSISRTRPLNSVQLNQSRAQSSFSSTRRTPDRASSQPPPPSTSYPRSPEFEEGEKILEASRGLRRRVTVELRTLLHPEITAAGSKNNNNVVSVADVPSLPPAGPTQRKSTASMSPPPSSSDSVITTGGRRSASGNSRPTFRMNPSASRRGYNFR
eukprot:PhM_4_TR18246/c0_g2_i1/m.80376